MVSGGMQEHSRCYFRLRPEVGNPDAGPIGGAIRFTLKTDRNHAFSTPPLGSVRLRDVVRIDEEENSDLLVCPVADVHSAMNAITRLGPVDLPGRDPDALRRTAVAELDVQYIAVGDNGYAMEGIAVPPRCFARCERQSSYQCRSPLMKCFLCHRLALSSHSAVTNPQAYSG